MSKILLSYTSGNSVYVYAHEAVANGDYSARVLATDTGNDIYYFDTDDSGFGSYAGAGEFDIAINPSDPANPGTFQAHLSQLGFFSKTLKDDFDTHTANTSNPHSVTLTQAIQADSTADTNLLVANLNTLVNGGDASNLHYHASSVEDETIGTGDGTTTTFNFTLSKTPIVAGTISITDGTETFSDNGDGTLTGDNGGTGTINYATGVGSVTFNTAPGTGISITADYKSHAYQPGTHADTHTEGGSDEITVTSAMITSVDDSKVDVSHSSFSSTDLDGVISELGTTNKHISSLYFLVLDTTTDTLPTASATYEGCMILRRWIDTGASPPTGHIELWVCANHKDTGGGDHYTWDMVWSTTYDASAT